MPRPNLFRLFLGTKSARPRRGHRQLSSVSTQVETCEVRVMPSVTSASVSASSEVTAGETLHVDYNYQTSLGDTTTASIQVTDAGGVLLTSVALPSTSGDVSGSVDIAIPDTALGQYTVQLHVRNNFRAPGPAAMNPETSVNVKPAMKATEITITGGGEFDYDGTAHSAAASVSEVGGGVIAAIDVAYYAGDTLLPGAPTDAGTYTVVANYAGDATHLPSSASATIVINQIDAIIEVTGYDDTYDGDAHGITVTATGLGGLDLSSLITNTDSFTNAGSHTANWSFEGNQNYKSASGTAAVKIAKADATIVASGYNNVYDGGAHGISVSATGVKGENLDGLVTTSENSFTDVSDNVVTWSFAGDGNYNSATSSASVVITPAKATISVTGYSGVYDGQAHGITVVATGVLGESLASSITNTETLTGAGSLTAHWSFSNHNYCSESGTALIEIGKKAFVGPIATQASLNVGKAGNLNFTIDPSSSLIPGETLNVFNGVQFTLAFPGQSQTYSAVATFNPLTGKLNVTWRVEGQLQSDLKTYLTSFLGGTIGSSTKKTATFTLTATTANYSLSLSTTTQMFAQ